MRNDFQPTDDSADAQWEALARYAAGESSPEEAASVRAWLDARPADAALVELARTGMEPAAPVVDVEAALSRVRSVIDTEARSAKATGAESRPSLSVVRGNGDRATAVRGKAPARWAGRRGIGFAAAAVLLLAIRYGVRDSDSNTVFNFDFERTPVAAERVHRTAVGVRDSIVLADGSRVVLAPGSILTVGADFDSSRSVVLQGAAYFEIKHDAQHPFTVRSGRAVVRDVGTAFSVNTDATGAVVVAVTEGVVAMATNDAPAATVGVELRAGDRGVVPAVLDSVAGGAANSEGAIQVSRGIVTSDDVAWTRGELTYHDTPLSVIQADLQRWYGIKLSVTDTAMLRQTLKVSFRGRSVAEALRDIALALGAETVQRGDSVVLRPLSRGTAPSIDR